MGTDTVSLDQLPDDILEEILLRVPGDLLCKKAVLVSKRWRELIESKFFWIEKSLRDRRLTYPVFRALCDNPQFNAKSIYFGNIFRANLLKNPCGYQRFKYWLYTSSYEISTFLRSEEYAKKYINDYKKRRLDERWSNDWWRVESGQSGASKTKPLLDANFKLMKNFVTSHRFVGKLQVIDVNDFITADFLRSIPLKLEVKEWYTSRVDCGSKYVLAVHLIDKNFNMIDNCIHEVRSAPETDGEWRLASHVFDIKSPIRYIIFYHAGCDTKTLNGYYGSKMTNGSVKFLLN